MTDGAARPWLQTAAAGDARRYAPATARNRDPIAEILRTELPERGLVLEIASGSGEHAVHFAELFPDLDWQPSDPDPLAQASIEAWRGEVNRPNLRAALVLDAGAPDWPVAAADALLCINMVHISPWAATLGLLDGAARILPAGAPLILYGPYLRDDVETSAGNAAFDIDLRARNPEWGIRRVEAVDAAAMAVGLEPSRLVEMPANNIIRVYRRAG